MVPTWELKQASARLAFFVDRVLDVDLLTLEISCLVFWGAALRSSKSLLLVTVVSWILPAVNQHLIPQGTVESVLAGYSTLGVELVVICWSLLVSFERFLD